MAIPRVDRRLAAILAADVVGYSRLVERDEADTLERLKAHRNAVIEPLVAECRGRIVKLMGDGALCEFGSVVDAMQCAVLIQRTMAEREADVPTDRRIRFRIGVNLGDIVYEDGDLYGDGVNIAARLERLAEPGGICLSGTAYDHLQGKLGCGFSYLGEQRVKNIARPVRVYRVLFEPDAAPAVVEAAHRGRHRHVALIGTAALVPLLMLAGGLWWALTPLSSPSMPSTTVESAPILPAAEALRPSLPLPEQSSIAVLPLTNLTDDVKQERLADGLTEDLITELARFRSLFVIARNSAFQYKGKSVDVRQVGRELGVRYVLEGSLQTDPERVRVTVQLVDAASGAHVWSERYDRPVQEFFAVRDDVVAQIAATLMGMTGPIITAAEGVARRRPPQSLGAYDLYLIGSAVFFSRRDPADILEARRLFDQAIALDPYLVAARYLLAWTWFLDALEGWSADNTMAWRNFHEAAASCAAADPLEGRCQVILGMSYFAKGQVEQGAAAWKRALALNPHDERVLRDVGEQLAIALGTEHAQEGVDLVKQALRLNPLHPEWQWCSLGLAHYFAGEFEQAIEAFKKVPAPTFQDRVFMALSYGQLGREEEAAAEVAEVLRQKPDFTAKDWVESDFYQPGGSSEALFLDGARKAGLPIETPKVN